MKKILSLRDNHLGFLLNLFALLITVLNFSKASMLQYNSPYFTMATVCMGTAFCNCLTAILFYSIVKYNGNLFYFSAFAMNISAYTTTMIWRSSITDLSYISKKVVISSLLFWGIVLVLLFVLPYLVALLDSRTLKKKALPVVITGCIIFTIVSFFLFDRESNTLTVFGVQVSLFAVMMLITLYAIFVNERNSSQIKHYAVIAIFCLTILLFVARETGIILLFVLSVILFNIFFNFRKRYLLYLSISVIVVGMVILGLLYQYGKSLDDNNTSGILQSFAYKIFLRTQPTEQGNSALEMISLSSIFGNVNYRYLFASSHEFLFSAQIYYSGQLTFFLETLLFMLCVWKYQCTDNQFNHFFWNIKNLFFVTMIVMTVYNFMMNIGLVPMIGVNAPFYGILSFSNIILSAVFLAMISLSPEQFEKSKDILNKKANRKVLLNERWN